MFLKVGGSAQSHGEFKVSPGVLVVFVHSWGKDVQRFLLFFEWRGLTMRMIRNQ